MSAKRRKCAADWTQDANGVSNNSRPFLAAVDAVAYLIRNQGHALINGYHTSVARLIVAQLAHKHGLTPAAPGTPAKGPGESTGEAT